MFFKQFFVYAWFIVIALNVGGGSEFDEVLVSGVIFGKKREMVSFIINVRFFLESRTVSDICLNSDDGLDAALNAFHIELNSPIHCTVIGQGHSRHTIPLC